MWRYKTFNSPDELASFLDKLGTAAFDAKIVVEHPDRQPHPGYGVHTYYTVFYYEMDA